MRHSGIVAGIVIIMALIVSFLFAPALQNVVGDYFNSERFPSLRGLLASTGGALVGATAIGFSVVMIAVQLNFARMPHGLFRRLSSDVRLLGAFAGTFLLAIGVSALSLVPDASWAARALIAAMWGTLLILILFLYGYRRALDLINPAVQLRLIVGSAQKDLHQWARRAQRMTPLMNLPIEHEDKEEEDFRSKHDLPRLAFFRANPAWSSSARRAVAHAVSFARRYAEQGDFEVSGRALEAVILINACYVGAKGKTFFASNPIFDIPETSDGFISDTLEHLRRLARVSTVRGDEEATRQILATMAALVQTYMAIDYAGRGTDTKEHAQLAAVYLAGAVEAIVPRNLPDLLMEGIRLMGASARGFLAAGHPDEITTLVEKIATFSVAGAVMPDYRPVTLTGMEQLAELTFDLLRTKAHDIGYAAKQLREWVEFVVQMFLKVPDTPFSSIHSHNLAPYYSLAKTQTLGDRLTDLCNALVGAEKDDELARGALNNFQDWSEELHRTEKTLLLLAIEKKSHFTFDILHWIEHVSKLLVALARAPAADDYTREHLERNAISLISVISWIPEDKETTQFVETFSLTELLFGAALGAQERESTDFSERARELLIEWAFKAGRYQTGWGTLGQAMIALATLVLWKEELKLVLWLKMAVTKSLKEVGVGQEMLDRAARDLRREAASHRRRKFETNRVRHALNQIEPAKLRTLLTEIADILSSGTAGEQVHPEFF